MPSDEEITVEETQTETVAGVETAPVEEVTSHEVSDAERFAALEGRCAALEARAAAAEERHETADLRLARLEREPEQTALAEEPVAQTTAETISGEMPVGTDVSVEETATATVARPDGEVETVTVTRRKYRRI